MRSISKAAKDLMFIEPFYGFYLLHLNKRFNNQIPTAGVYLNGINTGLDINEEFWNRLNDAEKVGILKHELLHICFFHLQTRDEYPDKQLFNIAADIEINQYIKRNKNENLPKGALDLNMFPTIKLDTFKGTKYYYNKLQENLQKPRKNGNQQNSQCNSQCNSGNPGNSGEENEHDNSGHSSSNSQSNSSSNQSNSSSSSSNSNSSNSGKGGNFRDPVLDKLYQQDMHGTWDQFEGMSDTEKKLIKKQVDHILKEAAKVTKKSHGTIPGELKQYIDKLLEVREPVFDWKTYLRRFLGGSTEIYTKKSRRKLSRRFIENPGLKIKKKKHILVAVDTSGSINQFELGEFFSEIYHIHKTGTQVTIVECDANIGDIYPYLGRFRGHITGGGGTSFQPVIDYYNDNNHKFTSLVYFTDGYASMPTRPHKQMMWVISSNGKKDYAGNLPGITIKIPASK